MKKTHIILLIAVAVVIAGLLTMMKDLSTYDTIASARKKEGRFVHLITRLDKSAPVVYDPVKDPNFLSFHALDSLGGRTRVVYRNAKPTAFERSERIVMTGVIFALSFPLLRLCFPLSHITNPPFHQIFLPQVHGSEWGVMALQPMALHYLSS